MTSTNHDVPFEVVQIDGQTTFLACDGESDRKNYYLTLLEADESDFHLSYNVRDSKLFIALNDGERDVGFSIHVNRDALQALGQKVLALSAQTSAN